MIPEISRAIAQFRHREHGSVPTLSPGFGLVPSQCAARSLSEFACFGATDKLDPLGRSEVMSPSDINRFKPTPFPPLPRRARVDAYVRDPFVEGHGRGVGYW